MTDARVSGLLWWWHPDGKTQVKIHICSKLMDRWCLGDPHRGHFHSACGNFEGHTLQGGRCYALVEGPVVSREAGAGLGPPGGHVVEGPVVSGEAGAGLGPPGGHVVEGPVVSGEAGAGLGPPGGQRRRGLSLAQELAQVWASRLLSGRDEEWLGRGDERASSPLASSLALR